MHQRRVRDRVAIFREKNIPRNTEHSAEDKNAQNSVPKHFVEEKNAELCYFVLNYYAEDKNDQNSVHFAEEKNNRKSEFCSVPLRGRKHFWKLVPNHSRTKKNIWMTWNSAKGALFSRNNENSPESIPGIFRNRISKETLVKEVVYLPCTHSFCSWFMLKNLMTTSRSLFLLNNFLPNFSKR
jgi:hypothetical protein